MQISQCQHMGRKEDRKRIVLSGRNRKDQSLQSKRNHWRLGKRSAVGSPSFGSGTQSPGSTWGGSQEKGAPVLQTPQAGQLQRGEAGTSCSPLPPFLPPTETLCRCRFSFLTPQWRKLIKAGKDRKRRGRRAMLPVLPFPNPQEERRVCTKVKTSAAKIATNGEPG